jgi:hypothetical protein
VICWYSFHFRSISLQMSPVADSLYQRGTGRITGRAINIGITREKFHSSAFLARVTGLCDCALHVVARPTEIIKDTAKKHTSYISVLQGFSRQFAVSLTIFINFFMAILYITHRFCMDSAYALMCVWFACITCFSVLSCKHDSIFLFRD